MELLVKPEMLTSYIYGAPSKARNANVVALKALGLRECLNAV